MTVYVTHAHYIWQHRVRPHLLLLPAPLLSFQGLPSILLLLPAHHHVVALPVCALVLSIPCSQLFAFKGEVKGFIASGEVGRPLGRHQLLGEEEGIWRRRTTVWVFTCFFAEDAHFIGVALDTSEIKAVSRGLLDLLEFIQFHRIVLVVKEITLVFDVLRGRESRSIEQSKLPHSNGRS